MSDKLREVEVIPERLFAVGDVHGCCDELEVLLRHLESGEGLSQRDTVVFVGDYVDRGPASKQVIDRLLEFAERFPGTVFLRGNHEDMLLGYFGFAGNREYPYLLNGGQKTLQSYGCPPVDDPEACLPLIPRPHLSFYLNLDSYLIVGPYVFVHAGLNPLRALRTQLDEDLFWIRDEFINNVHPFNKLVVFGHTPYENLLLHAPYKIGIDTGLVFGNRLSCLEVRTGKIISVERGANAPRIDALPTAVREEVLRLERSYNQAA